MVKAEYGGGAGEVQEGKASIHLDFMWERGSEMGVGESQSGEFIL